MLRTRAISRFPPPLDGGHPSASSASIRAPARRTRACQVSAPAEPSTRSFFDLVEHPHDPLDARHRAREIARQDRIRRHRSRRRQSFQYEARHVHTRRVSALLERLPVAVCGHHGALSFAPLGCPLMPSASSGMTPPMSRLCRYKNQRIPLVTRCAIRAQSAIASPIGPIAIKPYVTYILYISQVKVSNACSRALPKLRPRHSNEIR